MATGRTPRIRRRGSSLIAQAARLRVQRSVLREEGPKFWAVAASLGGFLVGEGEERCKNPLAWVAALEMAKQKVLEMGGEAMAKDWETAQKWRAEAAKTGLVFSIIEAPDEEQEP